MNKKGSLSLLQGIILLLIILAIVYFGILKPSNNIAEDFPDIVFCNNIVPNGKCVENIQPDMQCQRGVLGVCPDDKPYCCGPLDEQYGGAIADAYPVRIFFDVMDGKFLANQNDHTGPLSARLQDQVTLNIQLAAGYIGQDEFKVCSVAIIDSSGKAVEGKSGPIQFQKDPCNVQANTASDSTLIARFKFYEIMKSPAPGEYQFIFKHGQDASHLAVLGNPIKITLTETSVA
ncbi:MAG: hypothetical protein ABIA93_02815 [Candidatus Woesearchaeota archaeon]